MIEFAIHLEASDPSRNIWRSYGITAGQDIFENWNVSLTYGRIGARGRTKTILLPDEAEARRFVVQCLKKRGGSPKRIGISYKVKYLVGNCGSLIDGFMQPKVNLISTDNL